jgi:Ca2+-binding EF-hand superfamily protein
LVRCLDLFLAYFLKVHDSDNRSTWLLIDGSGHLNATEFGKICYDMGLYLDKLEIEAAMHKLDVGKDGYEIYHTRGSETETNLIQGGFHQNGSGSNFRLLTPSCSKIGFDEFQKWWQAADRVKILEMSENPVMQQAIQYFQRYDKDSSGSINVTEFKQLCTDLQWSTENIGKSLAALDKNGDGVIDFNEFLIWLRWEGL